MTQNIIVLIDGYNLYHSLKRINNFADKQKQYLKWLDLRALSENLVKPFGSANIVLIRYFTALASWRPESMSYHIFTCKLSKRGMLKYTKGVFLRKPNHAFLVMLHGNAEKRSNLTLI